MKLIDADALVDALMMYTWYDEDGWELDDAEAKREYIKKWLPDIPTVEAEPKGKDINVPTIEAEAVIHCKYCKHCVANGDGKTYHCWFTGAYVEEDDYCSQAESESNMG
jgi:hypothetical protein